MQQSKEKAMQITGADYADLLRKERNGILKAKNDQRAMHIDTSHAKLKENKNFPAIDHYQIQELRKVAPFQTLQGVLCTRYPDDSGVRYFVSRIHYEASGFFRLNFRDYLVSRASLF